MTSINAVFYIIDGVSIAYRMLYLLPPNQAHNDIYVCVFVCAVSPSGRYIFCLKKVDTFKWTFVRVSKMNDVAHAQLIFQILTLRQYICIFIYT